MAEMKMTIAIDGLKDMRRLSAALEQYNANSASDAAQIKRLEGHLIEARDELAYAHNLIKNRRMRAPGESYRTELLNEIAGLVDRDVRREIGSDHAATKHQLHTLEHAAERATAILNGEPVPPPLIGAPLTRLEEAALSAKGAARRAEEVGRVQRELSEARAELDRLRADLRKEHKIKAFVNDECQRVRAALGLDPMSEIGAVVAAVKGLNDVIKYLRIEHQDRADELAAAEAEIAKCKPLIDAVKHGAVFATCGQWVELRTWETEHTGDDATPTELKATFIDAGVLWL